MDEKKKQLPSLCFFKMWLTVCIVARECRCFWVEHVGDGKLDAAIDTRNTVLMEDKHSPWKSRCSLSGESFW